MGSEKKISHLDRQAVIQFLKDNKKYLEDKFGVTKIALYGSYARDEAGPDSDIDILIGTKDADFFNRFFLKEFLENNFNKNVDIGYFSSIRKILKEGIARDLIYV